MAKLKKQFSPGQHPNSQANLTYHSGRPPAYGENKRKRYLSVTDEGWEGTQAVVRAVGCASVSEFLEKLGRGELTINV